MNAQDVEFVIEGTKENPLLTFKIDGKIIQPARKTLNQLPVSGSIEDTIEDFKECFPEDRVTVTDNRMVEA